MDQWLIRTVQNRIAGPFTKDQVVKLVLDHKLGLQDEICPANGYWVYLYERDEVIKYLGVEYPVSKDGEHKEDVTETEIVTSSDDTTDPGLDFRRRQMQANGQVRSTAKRPASLTQRPSEIRTSIDPDPEGSDSYKSWFALLVIVLGIVLLLAYYFMEK